MNFFSRDEKRERAPLSRADEVRRKRTQPAPSQPATPRRQAARGASAAAVRQNPFPVNRQETVGVSRPVTVRNTTFGTPLRSRVATTNPRRQYYVPTSRPGTEIRLPALPHIGFGPRGISFVLAVLCVVGMYMMLYSPLFILTAPAISGVERLSRGDIEVALESAGLNAVEVNLHQLENNLTRQYDMIESATASLAFPNKLSLQIVERTPVFAWQIGDTVLWADEQGYLFAPAGDTPALLTVSSDQEPPTSYAPAKQQAIRDAEAAVSAAAEGGADSQRYQAALLALEQAKAASGPRMVSTDLIQAARLLTETLPPGTSLMYSADHGLGWLDAGGWDAYIGTDLSSFAQKINLYHHTVEQLASQGILPAVVSVEYPDTPYYRLER